MIERGSRNLGQVPASSFLVTQVRSGSVSRYPDLETGGQTEGVTTGWPDGITGKQTAEVDYVESVVDVLHVGLEAHLESVGAPDIGAERRVDRERWAHAAFVEVDAINNGLTVLRKGILFGAGELERKAGAVLRADSRPRSDP